MHSKQKHAVSIIEEQLESHPFIPLRFARNAYFQSGCSLIVPYFKKYHLHPERKYMRVPDGTQLAIDYIKQQNFDNHPSIVFLDGFPGSSSSRFSQRIAQKSYHYGFNVILVNQRGQGNTLHLTKSVCDSGMENDIAIALDNFDSWGFKKLYIVGLSYGGFLGLLTLGRLGKSISKNISGMAAISPAVDTANSWQVYENPSLARWYLIGNMKKLVYKRAKIDPYGTWDIGKIKKVRTLKQWDKALMHTWGYPDKFSSVEEYYDKVNVLPLIPNIHIPTLAIHAEDDPILPVKPFYDKAFKSNDQIVTIITKYGGHGGFIADKILYNDLDRHWAENRAIEFFRLLEMSERKSL